MRALTIANAGGEPEPDHHAEWLEQEPGNIIQQHDQQRDQRRSRTSVGIQEELDSLPSQRLPGLQGEHERADDGDGERLPTQDEQPRSLAHHIRQHKQRDNPEQQGDYAHPEIDRDQLGTNPLPLRRLHKRIVLAERTHHDGPDEHEGSRHDGVRCPSPRKPECRVR